MENNCRDPLYLVGISGDSVPVDVELIAKHLGITIEEKHFEDESIIGQITIENGQSKIVINPDQNYYKARKRFTIAHEIAHHCLHANMEFTDSAQTFDRKHSFWNRRESEANSFASELLMPIDMVVGKVQSVIDSGCNTIEEFISEMASIFCVSKKAMEFRLKNIKLLP